MKAMPARRAALATFGYGSCPRRFEGSPQSPGNRLVYAAVEDLLKSDIHALAIEALPPD